MAWDDRLEYEFDLCVDKLNMPRDKEWGLYGNVIECGKIYDLKKLRLNRIDNILNYFIFIKEQSLLHIVFEYFKTIVTFYHFAQVLTYIRRVYIFLISYHLWSKYWATIEYQWKYHKQCECSRMWIHKINIPYLWQGNNILLPLHTLEGCLLFIA